MLCAEPARLGCAASGLVVLETPAGSGWWGKSSIPPFAEANVLFRHI
jgi:hypothetical protein